MKRKAKIVFEAGIEPRVPAEFNKSILVSLDCDHCQRARRSVSLRLGEDEGKCHPGSAARWGGYVEHPPYTGKLADLKVERYDKGIRATYFLEYETEQFVDFKYGNGPGNSSWQGHPTWARVGFNLTCPECNSSNTCSVQNNLGRPWTSRCSCGYTLFREYHEMPLLQWEDPETGEWKQVSERFGAKKDC